MAGSIILKATPIIVSGLIRYELGKWTLPRHLTALLYVGSFVLQQYLDLFPHELRPVQFKPIQNLKQRRVNVLDPLSGMTEVLRKTLYPLILIPMITTLTFKLPII